MDKELVTGFLSKLLMGFGSAEVTGDMSLPSSWCGCHLRPINKKQRVKAKGVKKRKREYGRGQKEEILKNKRKRFKMKAHKESFNEES